MRTETFTNTVNIYQYEELTDNAKENVRQHFIEGDFRNDDYYDYCKECLYNDFANSDLDVQYSLSYCQGDGLNIYGRLALADCLKLFDCTEKEKRTLQFYFNRQGYIDFTANNRYCYSLKSSDKKNALEDYIYDIQYYSLLKNINKGLLSRFFNAIFSYFEKLESDWERNGYEYIYYEDENDLIDEINANEYEFLADGTIY